MKKFFGFDINEIYSDGSIKSIINNYDNARYISINRTPKETINSDGTVYNTYTLQYKEFSTEVTVEVIDIENIPYPQELYAQFQGIIKKEKILKKKI